MQERPNILWITTDQQRYDTINALGNPYINTPNLDRLCSEGTAFRQVYCQNPICTPSRASFLTGLYPSTVHANINGNRRFRTDKRIKLITRRLADAGYDCGLSGKLHLASAWNGVEERSDDGYRCFWYSHSPHQGRGKGNQYMQWLEAQGVFEEVFEETVSPNGEKEYRYRDDVPMKYHQTTWCADRAIDFMREERDGPWLMSVNIFDPHPPFDAPRSYSRRYDPHGLPAPLFRESDIENQERLKTHLFQTCPDAPGDKQQQQKASYYGMIELIDENVGRMLDALENSGQRKNTVVVFNSDHGEMLGDHGLTKKGCRFYEGLSRVPLIISWPECFQSGAECNALVELTDLAPTLAEIAGVDLPWTHGKSLMPILDGSAPEYNPRKYVRCEYYDTLNMQTPHGDPEEHVPSYATMYRDDRYKLVVYHGNDYGELYDLKNDPEEFRNLWEVPEMKEVRQELIRCSFDAGIIITDPGSERVGRY